MAGRSKGHSAPRYGGGLRTLSILTVVAMAVDLALIFFWVPREPIEGFLQKNFYVHVPLAITCLCGYIAGGIFAALQLRTRERKWDMRSYVAIHMSLIFSVGTLITGSIWARGSWGHWWVWNEPELTSFLIVFLLYACYQPLRFSIEDPERQSTYASVFAVVAGVFVPLCFVAVRLSTTTVHPEVFNSTSDLPWQVSLTFLVSLCTIGLMFVTLCKYELTAKHTRAQMRALRARLTGEFEGPRGRSAQPMALPGHAGAPTTPAAPAPGVATGRGATV